MDHVLLALFRCLERDLIDRAQISGFERRVLTRESRNDYLYARRRFQKEGNSFFTKTTPAYAKHLIACLEAGSYTPLQGFAHARGGNLPLYLRGWIARIFDQGTGSVLDDVCSDALRAIRQLCLFANKAEALPADSQCALAFREFIDDDTSISQESLWSKSISTFGYTHETNDQWFTVDRKFRSIGDLGRLFSLVGKQAGWEFEGRFRDSTSFNRRPAQFRAFGDLIPKHGPGSVAERLDDDGKWELVSSSRHNHLDDLFDTFWFSFQKGILKGNQQSDDRLPQACPPSRLIAVPKTATKPRLIAAEPCLNQFWQQALMGFMNAVFRDSPLRESIDSTSQGKSQDRALEGSTSRNLATIDLSKASDFVTLDHVGVLFQHDSLFLASLLACRTERVDVPEHGSHRLRKFASMGSAVCFPIESLVFLVAMTASILRQDDNLNPTTGQIWEASRKVTVYGDDIILPTQYFTGALRDLAELGFNPNMDKSFAKSSFRESCGVEFYGGTDVKPCYVRVDIWSRKRLLDSDVPSLVATSRQMVDIGLFRTAEKLLDLVENETGVALPYAEDDPGYLAHNCIWRSSRHRPIHKWNEDWQRMEQLVLIPTSLRKLTSLDGYVRLLRYFVRSQFVASDPNILDLDSTDWAVKPTRGSTLERNYA